MISCSLFTEINERTFWFLVRYVKSLKVITTRKKLNKVKIHNSKMHQRTEVTDSGNWKDRWRQTVTVFWEQRLQAVSAQTLEGVINKLLEAQCGCLEGKKLLRETPTLSWILIPGALPGFPVKLKKNSLVFLANKHFEIYPEYSVLFNKDCPQGNLFHQSLNDQGEEKYPTPAPSSPQMGMVNTQGRLSKRQRPSYRTINAPPQHPHLSTP